MDSGSVIISNIQLENEFPRPGFSLFEYFRQKIGLIFCKHNCIGPPHGPES